MTHFWDPKNDPFLDHFLSQKPRTRRQKWPKNGPKNGPKTVIFDKNGSKNGQKMDPFLSRPRQKFIIVGGDFAKNRSKSGQKRGPKTRFCLVRHAKSRFLEQKWGHFLGSFLGPIFDPKIVDIMIEMGPKRGRFLAHFWVKNRPF